ncbi:MAG: hypothetical protein AABM30_13385 [Actinomycetota bacterium]
MRSALTLLTIAVVGLFGATSIGYASYLVSRDSVGLPVTKLKLSPNQLAPATTKRKAAKPKATTTSTTTRTSARTTTDDHGDDRGGRSPNSGKGSGSSGSGHGGDDD